MARERKRHGNASENTAPGAVPDKLCETGPNGCTSHVSTEVSLHPRLIQIVRLLARQAAIEDVAAQRAIPLED